MRRRTVLALGLAGLGALAGGGAVWRSFAAALDAARARTVGRSTLVATRFGALEYAAEGDGPPVLMVHGTGGGFDQGLDFARRLAAAGRRVIAPSRFGYLRSAAPAEPSAERQADAFADLLDALGIERAPVIGGSAGALSALQFAIRHPSRCSALVAMVPAAWAPTQAPPQPPGPFAQAIIDHALQSDFLFWLGLQLGEDSLIGALLATDPALVARAAPEERARVRAILEHILPVSDRAAGFRIDARLVAAAAPMALETIRAPTLALSLADDRFETLVAARHIAATVPGARLVALPEGGHVWVGHDAEVFAEVSRFLAEAGA